MPVFELVVVLQKLEREALKAALKRTAGYIFEREGVLRKIENLGCRELPFYIKSKGKKHNVANFFIFNYDVGPSQPRQILEKLKLDLDVVRGCNFLLAKTPMDLHYPPKIPKCTLHEDLLPAPMRSKVIKLQNIGRAKNKTLNAMNNKNSAFNIF